MNHFTTTTPIPVTALTPYKMNQAMNQQPVFDVNQNQLLNNQLLNTKNYQSMCQYIDNLFSRYARLLVIRLDLGYGKDVDTPYMTDDEIYAAYCKQKKIKNTCLTT